MTRRIRRLLKRDASGTCAIVLIVALLSGGGAVAYATVHAALVPTLRVDPERRLVALWRSARNDPNAGHGWLSFPDFNDLQSRSQSLELLTAWRSESLVMRALNGEPVRVQAAQVGGGFFELVPPRLLQGRRLQRHDDLPGAAPVVVLSETVWRNHLRGTPDVIGRGIPLGDKV